MSGHSQFAPIGNQNQPIPMPPVGGVGNDADQPENVQQVQQQGQPVVEEPNPPAARSLTQKLDSMLLKAATLAAKSLGLDDVIPKCIVGMHNGEYGLFMEKVPGIEASDFAKGKAMPNGGLFNERRVVAKDDFEKKDVQQSLLSREVNAGNPVKPVGNFQLQRKEGVEVKKCVVSVARLQTRSIFMRDMYGRVNKKGWFK